MSKFDKIIKKSVIQLKEGIQDANNPTIKQAVDVIDKALNNNGQVQSNANAKALANTMFGSSIDDSTNPLHSAFDKIKQNPDNPNLEDHEKEAYLKFADKFKPTQQNPENQENQEDKQEKKPTTTSTTSNDSSNKTEQPNATQYDPMNQPKSY